MDLYLQNLHFTANIVAPIFLIVFLGIALKRAGMIDKNFVLVSSKLVFNVTLPVFLFMKLSRADFSQAMNVKQIVYVYAATLLLFGLSWLLAVFFISEGRNQGVFIQGSFRSNFAIVGVAIVANMFGEEGLGNAAVLLAFVVPLFNVLSIIALTAPLRKDLNRRNIWREILTNPLILGLLAAVPVAYFHVPIPELFERTGNYLAALTLPLALLGIGGGLNFKGMKDSSGIALSSTFIKLVVAPLLFTVAAYWLGFAGEEIVVLFILFASPTAVVSFIMAEAMGGNSKLAGDIVLYTTLASVLTLSSGIFLMKTVGVF